MCKVMRKLLCFLALSIGVCACSGEKISVDDSTPDPASAAEDISHEMIVLGAQLEDPFSVSNMTKALASLYPTKADRVVLDPTDVYVRFLPSGDEQYTALEEMGLVLIDHPVDYEILKEGDYYHDPEVPEGDITWQYAVVPVGFEFPESIAYEVLDDVFIAENSTTKADCFDWDAVEREAYRITGNEGLLCEATKAGGTAPSGCIQIRDDAFPDEIYGVKGVRVSCNSFVKFAHAYTDEDGNYAMTRTFTGNPRYRLVFKNSKGFGIGFNLLLVPASFSTLGKNGPEGVSVVIDSSSERKLFCRSVVNNAAYDYYESCEGDGDSICTPPANLRFWLFQGLNSSSAVMLQQGAWVSGSLLADFLGEYLPLLEMFLPDITLGLKSAATYADIYSVAVHEMAHASHFMQVGTDYWDQYIKFVITSWVTSGFVTYGAGTEKDRGFCEVGEMWAYYVQTVMYRERYPDSDKVYGTSYWFSPQIFLNLDERGLDRFKIFEALTSEVTDRDLLQTKLISLYTEMKSTINQAFGRYK